MSTLYLAIYKDTVANNATVDLQDAYVTMMLDDEAHVYDLIEIDRYYEELDRMIKHQEAEHNPLWDKLTDTETYEDNVDDIYTSERNIYNNEEQIYLDYNNSQNMAITALQSAEFALKRVDTELLNLGIDDEDIKVMVLWCQSRIQDIQEIERIF